MKQILLFILASFCIFAQEASAFAAGKKGGKKGKSKTVVGRGFGVSNSPSVEEIAAKFPTRMPDNAEEVDCPCETGKKYKDCCAPFHKKEKLPASPVDVLRSRYSAFAWRLPLYIIDTTHPECSDWRKNKVDWVKDLNRDGMFDSYDFISLEAGPQEISEDNDKEGFIEFKVNLRANQNIAAVEGEQIVVSERSRFLCSGEPASWTYAGGDVTSDVAGIEDVKLNN